MLQHKLHYTCDTQSCITKRLWTTTYSYTSQIRFCSSSVSFGKSLRAISICKPTMYSLQMSINCCAYNTHATPSCSQS